MALVAKFVLIFLSIALLSIYPALFDIKKGSGFSFSRLTTAGRVWLGLAIVLITLNIVLEYKKHKEDEESTQALNDIKAAIGKAGLVYDSTSKTIVNNMSYSNDLSGIKISGNVGGTFTDLKSYMITPPPITPEDTHSDAFAPFSADRLKTIMDYVKEKSEEFKTKRVIVLFVNEEIQRKSIEQVVFALKSNGYDVVGQGTFTPKIEAMPIWVVVGRYDDNTISVWLRGR